VQQLLAAHLEFCRERIKGGEMEILLTLRGRSLQSIYTMFDRLTLGFSFMTAVVELTMLGWPCQWLLLDAVPSETVQRLIEALYLVRSPKMQNQAESS
jgi:hypothetical protein